MNFPGTRPTGLGSCRRSAGRSRQVQIELRRFLHQATWHLASEKMVEACERPDGIAKPRTSSFKCTGNDQGHFFWIARHARRMRIACTKHLLHPGTVRATLRLNTRGAFPDLGAIRPRLYKADLYSKRLKLKDYRLRPSFDRPFGSAIDRVCGLPQESSLTRNDDNPSVSLRTESRKQSASQPKHAEKIGVHHPPKLSLWHILQCASGRHAGIVHDSVEFVASSRQYRSSRCLDRGLTEDIELLDLDAILHAGLFQCLLE